MRKYIKSDEWKIIEEGFDPAVQKASESIFSLGNGGMGQRANFEEKYSGPTLQGNYIAGVYYPDKTRVGWWKNGYPEYFAKVLNAPNWVGVNIEVEGEQLDLFTCKTSDFVRTLDMRNGVLSRSFVATLNNKKQIRVETQRFLSMAENECACIKYAVTPLNFSGHITFEAYIDGDVENEDSNYDEKFWNIINADSSENSASLLSQTKKLDFRVAVGQQCTIRSEKAKISSSHNNVRISNTIDVLTQKDETVVFEKFVDITSSLNHKPDDLIKMAHERALNAKNKGFDKMLQSHTAKWDAIWEYSDIKITGDIEAQQGIRYNIFQLNQTYTGEDERLNIGPKGFTGEKYGGTTYWDTEAYCLPFYLGTAEESVAKNLLLYRYRHLEKAKENAEKLGFTDGAALYPMVTMNGEECHNEWEITFEEIHRNGAIAYAIYNYVNYTGDRFYLIDYGLEVLIAISRFWAQRVNFSKKKGKYVILGVTGPNEYENNVNNNWYTNRIASWTLEYTLELFNNLSEEYPDKIAQLKKKVDFRPLETEKWQ